MSELADRLEREQWERHGEGRLTGTSAALLSEAEDALTEAIAEIRRLEAYQQRTQHWLDEFQGTASNKEVENLRLRRVVEQMKKALANASLARQDRMTEYMAALAAADEVLK